ncbi:pyridoxine/pyridoxamine 5'-phosphate oxidase [Nocardiopsis trehalosi]|jgi:pyridoxamine 5'-phosphate oxidase|uniref:pyridoxine/pyridoxamine 5'-phosphate oxidase n=1 Tax=Nocardiopsis trehalosi TaxID=109329 RepID=UPI000834F91B|nr:pyridoxal 5'-phosphate synthase [Nocardiopsis trehalosi]
MTPAPAPPPERPAHSGLRARLRALPVFATAIPRFDPDAAPDDPVELFASWLDHAVAAGVAEPHVVNLATVDAEGRPSSRFLLLKDVDADGWRFASTSAGPKGAELAANPHAALAFYWSRVARQVRVRGTVAPEDPRRCAADFLARSPAARAEALAGGQSTPVASRAELAEATAAARARVAADPGLVDPHWTLYTLRPEYVEFWQADRDRAHIRLRYTAATGGGWTRSLLRP